MSNTPRSDSNKRGDFVHIRFARELERENAELRRWHGEIVIEKDDAQRALTNAKAENAALREDKARLDWLAVSDAWFDTPADEAFTPRSFRDAIDALRKEVQP